MAKTVTCCHLLFRKSKNPPLLPSHSLFLSLKLTFFLSLKDCLSSLSFSLFLLLSTQLAKLGFRFLYFQIWWVPKFLYLIRFLLSCFLSRFFIRFDLQCWFSVFFFFFFCFFFHSANLVGCCLVSRKILEKEKNGGKWICEHPVLDVRCGEFLFDYFKILCLVMFCGDLWEESGFDFLLFGKFSREPHRVLRSQIELIGEFWVY